ncbi:MAG TPA: orotidine-5'-phosphate decarboxylase, partial [Phnomibacter sp.]|nr:orotidine-5'-phosphate decarboxylase [Phnomibacter sp.]
MTRSQLAAAIKANQSFLCVGLDTDMDKLPAHLPKTAEGVLAFNKAIIDATLPYCVAYKINSAFFEAMGAQGWQVMKQTFDYIPATHLKIADAKRGDIGNTSHQYARAFFEVLGADAVTVAPYMGEDSVRPFLEYPGKWTIVLGLTSNPGSQQFQRLKLAPAADELLLVPN